MDEPRIARIAGYSPDGRETYNPALQDATKAFRAAPHPDKGQLMQAGWLDYLALLLLAGGFIALFLSLVTGGALLFLGILVPVGLFVELAAVSLRRRGRHNFYK